MTPTTIFFAQNWISYQPRSRW